MLTNKRKFFYVFYLLLFTIFSYIFGYFVQKSLGSNQLNSINDIAYIAMDLFMMFLIVALGISFVFSIKDYLSRKELYIFVPVSAVLVIIYIIIFESHTLLQVLGIVLYALVMSLYVFLMFIFKSKKFIDDYFHNIFFMIIFIFIFMFFAFGYNYFSEKDNSKNLLETIIDNNLIVIDILNNNSKEILHPYVLQSYNEGFENGYYSYCIENKILGCSIGNFSSHNYIDSYFSRDVLLFEKSSFLIAIEDEIENSSRGWILNAAYYFFIFFILIIYVFALSFVLIILNYISFWIIKFFSWLFDPLGIDKFAK